MAKSSVTDGETGAAREASSITRTRSFGLRVHIVDSSRASADSRRVIDLSAASFSVGVAFDGSAGGGSGGGGGAGTTETCGGGATGRRAGRASLESAATARRAPAIEPMTPAQTSHRTRNLFCFMEDRIAE